ncbi:GNAT family N-acetyltransferase [Indiicoccus explosivorum]|uniref:GNAT family N-acetyltransferase n=1 Tax=Indiicoccus explosivorum TaxID=1917864 RepID=UPI000B43B961|nr:GNAT family N-acetyltransferase [Indiicoccus explosivorum]
MKNGYVFESERLGFRRWKESDRDLFASLNADAEVMKYFPDVLTRKESDLLIQRFEDHHDEKGFGIWAVERKEDGEFIGFIGLLEVKLDVDFQGVVEIGWRLDKKYWKQGYAVEGAKACLDFAFERLNLTEVYSFTACVNAPSETVMRRIGMTKIKEFDHPKIGAGSSLKRHVLYRISRTAR